MKRKNNTAFTLIEVNLAILLIAVGLVTLFALFPLGLRESEMSVVDTHEAMFADHVLSGIEGNASKITDWNTWKDAQSPVFKSAVRDRIYPIQYGTWEQTAVGTGSEYPDPLLLPAGHHPRTLRYLLTIEDADASGRRKTVELQVKSGEYGQFINGAQIYYTELIYLGM